MTESNNQENKELISQPTLQFQPPLNSRISLYSKDNTTIDAIAFSGLAMSILSSNPDAKIKYWIEIQN